MLIICSECGKEYSDQAKSCPHCGAITSQNKYISKDARNKYTQNSNNSNSIVSLVCGIISFFVLPFIFGIISIIFGIVGLSKQEEKTGYSVIGIILGIIGILWAFYSTGNL